MNEKYPMTQAGYRRLQEDLKQMKSVERPKITRAIEEARAHGDLSENAEYSASKEAQGILEARIRDVENKLANAQVVDVKKLTGDTVMFGATVEIIDCDSDTSRTIRIVGEDEADVEKGLISFKAPLARGLIGRGVGDFVEIKLPSGEKEYEIGRVRFE